MNNYDKCYEPAPNGKDFRRILWIIWVVWALALVLGLLYPDAFSADSIDGWIVPKTSAELRSFFLAQSRDPFRPPGQQQANPAARMPGVDQSTFEYLKGQEAVNDAKRRADQCAQACSDRGNRTNSDCHQRCLAEYKRIVEEFVKKRQGKR